MDSLLHAWSETDAVGRAVALLLLAMSVLSWVLILWKSWVLRRAAHDIERGIAAFWAAPDRAMATERVAAIDREGVLQPLLQGLAASAAPGSLAEQANARAQLTRRLRDALHRALAHLRTGQVALASIGSTAPFIGLFGTVWGIYHALVGITAAGGVTVEKVSGPVGEALIMTAAGLAVAIPAVLAYNAFGHWIDAAEAELEGFAQDLLDLKVLSP